MNPQTPAPAAPDLPIPQPGRVTQPPTGASANADSAAPAGFQGDEFRRKVKAALAEHNAAGRRRTRRPRGGRYQAGMARRPAPDVPPDDAA